MAEAVRRDMMQSAFRRGFTYRLDEDEAKRHIAAASVFNPDVSEHWVPVP
jgi:hypothetical protein